VNRGFVAVREWLPADHLAWFVIDAVAELERADIEQPPEAVAADAGYWNVQHINEVTAKQHIRS
jgi:hypothetical protein